MRGRIDSPESSQLSRKRIQSDLALKIRHMFEVPPDTAETVTGRMHAAQHRQHRRRLQKVEIRGS